MIDRQCFFIVHTMRRLVRAACSFLAFSFSLASGCSAQASRLGTIDFPTSGSAPAQLHFIRGVLFLHSFEYDSAAHEFREAERRDPKFAMAYWGEAMTYTHPVWNEQDLAAARKALARLAPTRQAREATALTAREQAYLDAVEILYGEGSKPQRDTLYSAAMDRLSKAYPTDMEAQAFHALSLLGLNQGVRDVPTYLRAGAMAEEVFRRNPDHPGAAHYIIHAYDDPAHAPRGLRAAKAYSQIAPGAAHAQHMTTHIFLAMGMWDDVVSQNEIASGHSHEAWTANHYTFWLNYAYLQQGRYAEALKMIDMIGQHVDSTVPRSMWELTAMRAHYLVDTEKWDAPATWEADFGQVGADGRAAWALVSGLGAAKRGDHEGIARALAAVSAARLASADKDPADDIAELKLKALARLDEGASEEAVALMRQAIASEDALPIHFGPPTLLKPSHELFGEILLQLGRPKEAQSEFRRALMLAPKRARSLLGLGRASAAAGDTVSASEAFAALRAIWHRADSGQLALVGEAKAANPPR
jgi:tetratricopeptide (TPR) repeat protein